MNILVTGGTGAIGPSCVRALLAAGHRVRLLTRRDAARDQASTPSVEADAHAGAETVRGDLLDADSLDRATHGMDAVVHLAALLHRTGAQRADPSDHARVNVDATRTLLDAARRHGVRRVVFASTIAVYGDTHGLLATEDTPPAPDGPYATSKLEAEALVLAARTAAGEPLGVALRLCAIYGAGIKGHYRQLVVALARRRFVAIGRGDNRRSLIHDEDVARAIGLALADPAAPGRLFNLTDGEPHQVRAILAAICAALGRRPPTWHVPVPLARAAAGSVERLAALARRPAPVTRAMIDKYLEEAAVDSARIRRELGFGARMGLAAGWRDTVQGLRRAGVLPGTGAAEERRDASHATAG